MLFSLLVKLSLALRYNLVVIVFLFLSILRLKIIDCRSRVKDELFDLVSSWLSLSPLCLVTQLVNQASTSVWLGWLESEIRDYRGETQVADLPVKPMYLVIGKIRLGLRRLETVLGIVSKRFIRVLIVSRRLLSLSITLVSLPVFGILVAHEDL